MSSLMRARGVIFAALTLSILSVMPVAASAAGTNLISNPGFETGTGNVATDWSTSLVGTNNAAFSIIAGPTSARAAQVAITTYTNGDAKWAQTTATTTVPGHYYTFSDWYKSNRATEIDLFYTCTSTCVTNDGVSHSAGQVFQWLMDVPASPSGAWSQLPPQGFLVPAGVTSIRITHTLAGVGVLAVDDMSFVESATAPTFSQGIVTLSFDDGWQTFQDVAKPILDTNALKATTYIITGPDGSNVQVANGTPNGGYMSSSTLKALQANGMDIQAHTRSHIDLVNQTLPFTTAAGATYTTAQDIWTGEIVGSKSDLTGAGFTPVDTFAYPYGAYNAAVKSQVQAAGFSGARSIDQGYNFTSSDKFALKIMPVSDLTTSATIKSWIDKAIIDKTWLILMFHHVRTGNQTTGLQNAQCVDGTNTAIRDTDCTTSAVLQDVAAYLHGKPSGTTITMTQGIPLMTGVTPVNHTITASAGANGTITPSGAVSVANNASQAFTFTPAAGFMLGALTVDGLATTTTNPFTFTAVTANHTIAATFVSNSISAPVVTLTTTAPSNTNLAQIPVTATFSKPVSGFDATDVTATGGVVGSFVAASTTVYTFSVTPNADGPITVAVAAGAAADIASTTNKSVASNVLAVTSNRSVPVITLNGDAFVSTPVGSLYTDAGAVIVGTTTLPVRNGTVATGTVGTYTINYNFTDTVGNVAATISRTVVVTELGIQGETSSNVTSNSVTINWMTAASGTSRVVWDTVSHNPLTATSTNYGYAHTTVENSATTTSHSVVVSGLTAGTKYYFRAISHGSPEVVSAEITATTAGAPAPAPVVSSGGGGGGGGGNGPISGSLGQGGSLIPGGNVSSGGTIVPGATVGTVLGASTFIFTRDLSKGMRNNDVLELQKRLMTENFLRNSMATNYFGMLTFKGVKAYQSSHNLPPLGKVGPKTRAVLNGTPVVGNSGNDNSKSTLIALLKAQLAELLKQIAAMMSAGNTGSTTTATSTSIMSTSTSGNMMGSSTMPVSTTTAATTTHM